MGRAADGKAPKSEIRNPKEGRSPKSEKPAKRLGSGYVLNTISKNQPKTRQCRQQRIRIRASDFGLLSDFGFRASDFCPVVSVTLRAESMLPTTNVEEPPFDVVHPRDQRPQIFPACSKSRPLAKSQRLKAGWRAGKKITGSNHAAQPQTGKGGMAPKTTRVFDRRDVFLTPS